MKSSQPIRMTRRIMWHWRLE